MVERGNMAYAHCLLDD